MFDIGFAELTLIFIIGLVVLGPERLPTVARTLGHAHKTAPPAPSRPPGVQQAGARNLRRALQARIYCH